MHIDISDKYCAALGPFDVNIHDKLPPYIPTPRASLHYNRAENVSKHNLISFQNLDHISKHHFIS